MEIKDRIKQVRKTMNLNQTEFGKKVGTKQSSIASYENGSRQPLDAVINSICREFSVSEKWLRTGEGDMFIQKRRKEQIAEYFHDLQGLNDELKNRLVAALAAIQTKDWEIIRQIVEKIVRDSEMKDAVESQQDGESAEQRQNIHLVQAAHQRTDIDIPEDIDTSDDEFFD